MIRRNIPKIAVVAFVMLIVFSVVFAFAANIVVPSSRLTDQTRAITLSDLVPAECDSIRSVLTTVHVCSGGNCMASNANELILGTAGDDQIDGKNGLDCIVGGGGDDSLNGGNDDDILIGNDGNDTLDGGPKKDNDICYGGTGANTFVGCDLTP
jgi:Ca2+-binding RTX toxin-like protein